MSRSNETAAAVATTEAAGRRLSIGEGSPLHQPSWEAHVFRAWLWSQIVEGNDRVVNTLLWLRKGDVVVGGRREHRRVVVRAARWLQVQVAAGCDPTSRLC